MSGPKVSVYELTGQQRAWFYGQIRCEQSCISCAKQIQEMVSEIACLRGDIEIMKANVEIAQNRLGGRTEEAVLINGLLNRLLTEPSQILQGLLTNMPKMSEKYVLSQAALDSKQAMLDKLKALKKELTVLRKEASELVTKEGNREYGVVQELAASIADDVAGSISFVYMGLDSASSSEKSFAEEKAGVALRLSNVFNGENLPREIVSEILSAQKSLDRIKDAAHLHSFTSITVNKLLQRISNYLQETHEKEEEFKDKISRYQTLCTMAEVPPKECLFSDISEAELDTEIQRIEMILIKQQEQIYISECVDDVMSEMGYDLIGTRDVKKRSGKKFKNELFTFNEGTAINVTYSSDGQIAMELGGIAREDRLPTEEETSVLTKDMETFCGEFEEFEQRLREKGVIVCNRTALSPPSAEYAAIINIRDYEVDDGKQVTEISSGKKRTGKTIENKVLRRND